MNRAATLATLILCLLLGACASPRIVSPAAETLAPRLTETHARMPDGYQLPLRSWPARPARDKPPDIVVLGLHGFNDYANAFAPLARSLADAGITTYAIDQRGFGATALAGRWHGSRQLVADLTELTDLLRQRHPTARLYLIGESMGGAVVISALTQASLPVDGAVLIAPAVWSRGAMPWYQRLALDTFASIAPGMRLTGEGISLQPSDNIAMLRAMGADPLVIKATRVDALWGITNLMDQAMRKIPDLAGPLLLLYGEHDEIIPRRAFCRMLSRLPSNSDKIRLALYRRGWHMLPRDLQGQRVHQDVIAWLRDPRGALPSGEEAAPGSRRTDDFCASPSAMIRSPGSDRSATDKANRPVARTEPPEHARRRS